MIATPQALELSGCQEFLQDRAGREPAWLTELRQDALSRLAEIGLPSSQTEEWKHTRVPSMADCLGEPIKSMPGTGQGLGPEATLASVGLSAAWPGPVAVLVDGALVPAASQLRGLPRGVRISSLAAGLERSDRLASVLRAPLAEADGVALLNAILATDGLLVEISGGTTVPSPLLLLYLGTSHSGDRPVAHHHRSLILAGARSQVDIVEIHAPLGGQAAGGPGERPGDYLNSALVQVRLAAGATLTHTRVQAEGPRATHLGRIDAEVGADASYTSKAVSYGAAMARHDIVVQLEGPGASCKLEGLYLAQGRQHMDFHTAIDHAYPHTTSSQLYKGLIDGEATGVFNGKVVVCPGARKASARQSNRNLLLSPKAQVYTKPQLEIFHDDVKCSHGATVGQLDPAALFYLRSRGLSEPEARQILIRAFADEILKGIEPECLRDFLEAIR